MLVWLCENVLLRNVCKFDSCISFTILTMSWIFKRTECSGLVHHTSILMPALQIIELLQYFKGFIGTKQILPHPI